MKLNRQNYEEYFILYLDNELGSEDRREVEIFADNNPDLRAELDMLLQSKVSPDTDIVFGNKESLMLHGSSAISMNNYEGWLLSYIDNELTEQEIKDVERFVAGHPSVKKELELFQKTKLQPEMVAFPNIESLYRKEEKAKVIAISWRRIAVAAILLIGISTTAIILLDKKSGGGKGEIVKGQPETKTPTDIKVNNETPTNQQAIVNTNDKKNEPLKNNNNAVVIKKDKVAPKDKPEHLLPVKEDEIQIANHKIENKPTNNTNNLPSPVNNPNVIPPQVTGDASDVVKTNPKVTLTNPGDKTGATSVTQQRPDTYNPQEHAAGQTNDNPDAVFASNDGKKNKLRGFFRKVTRTFEKRTNMKATDEDEDHLLIAGLSIKLN